MEEHYGIIFLDGTELIIRIYLISQEKWKLAYYFNRIIEPDNKDAPENALTLAIAEVFSSEHTQHIAEWSLCTRNADTKAVEEIEHITGCIAERLKQGREQELICKGMFTELW